VDELKENGAKGSMSIFRSRLFFPYAHRYLSDQSFLEQQPVQELYRIDPEVIGGDVDLARITEREERRIRGPRRWFILRPEDGRLPRI
jgi:hypothetical protein